MSKRTLVIWLFLALQGFTNVWPQGSPNPKEPTIPDSAAYLGQTPPGDTPVVFAPGIVSLPDRSTLKIVFSPDGRESLIGVRANDIPTILYARQEDGHWTKPETATLLVASQREKEPFFSPDGSRIFFVRFAAIWVSKRINQSWAAPEMLGSPINVAAEQYHPTVTLDGTLYFCSNRGGEYNIYRSKCENGSYSVVEKLEGVINSHGNGADGAYDPYIAPDESYIIFSSVRNGGYGNEDQYIRYNRDGHWTNPKNLGSKINTGGSEYGSNVSPKNNYYLFARSNKDNLSEIYWVRASFIDTLKHTNYVPYVNRIIPDQSFAIGQSFSFAIPGDAFVDDDGNNTLTYSAVLGNGDPLPSWLRFNPGTRTFSGTPPQQGKMDIKIVTTDNAGAVASTTFTLLATNAEEKLMKAAGSTVNAQINGPYFGQVRPGKTPLIFAPGIISLESRLETYPTFSPDGKTLYFSVVNGAWTEGKILYTRLENGVWTKPEAAPFSDDPYINWESFISPDGKRMFFASDRPPSSGMDLWMVERTPDASWSAPIHLPDPINSAAQDGSPCITNAGTLYFKSLRTGGTGGSWLYRAIPKDGAYAQIDSLGKIIKTTSGETEPFMSPDESYLIFASETRKGGKGGWDLWICFRQKDGSWTEPVNLGLPINTAEDEYGPRVSPEGKYLLFTREKRGESMDIYWVAISAIEKLIPQFGKG